MRTLAMILLILGAPIVQGCTIVPGVEATDLSVLRRDAATRAEVEAVLGAPVASRATESGTISVYRYDRGTEESLEGPMNSEGFRGAMSGCFAGGEAGIICLPILGLVMVGTWLATPILYADNAADQEGLLAIVYDPDGTVSHNQAKAGDSDADAFIDLVIQDLQRREEAEIERRRLAERAEAGDPDAQWALAVISPRGQRDRLACLAAHGGSAEARAYVVRRSLGRPPSGIEIAKKTADAGEAVHSSTPTAITDIADAERLAAEWQPDPAGCGAGP